MPHECQDIGCHHPFDLAGRGLQVALQAGQRNIDDVHVDQVHEAGKQQDEQHEPAPLIRLLRRYGLRLGHARTFGKTAFSAAAGKHKKA
jgi:hypothetical protein